MSDQNTPQRSSFTIFLAGALIGGVVALLYAPQSGKETRKLLAKKGQQLKDKAQDTVEGAQEYLKDRTADLAAVFDAGKDAVEHGKHKRG